MSRKIFLIVILLSVSNNYLSGFVARGKITTTTDTVVQYAVIRFVSQQDTTISYDVVTNSLGEYEIILTGVTEDPTFHDFQLKQNYPNPFSERTTIPYSINENTKVTVTIYDILGRRVKNFLRDYMQSGTYAIEWDGKDAGGSCVSYGVYYYCITTTRGSQTKKMIYTKGNDLGLDVSFIVDRSSITSGNRNLNSDTYNVIIESSDSTKPKVEFTRIDNVVISGDTTLNFIVNEAYEWELLGLGDQDVKALAIHPINPDIIYAGSLQDFSAGGVGKLFRSTDAGTSWDTLLVGGSYMGVAIDPINPDIIYALPYDLIKSTDGGETWMVINNGIGIDFETRLSSFAIDSYSTNTIYAGTGGMFGGRLYKSTNGGESWIQLSRSDTLSGSINSIAIDPSNSDIVYVGASGLGEVWKTTDAGYNWTLTGLGQTFYGFHALGVSPADGNLTYAAISFMGLYKSENGGVSWDKTKLEGTGANSILFSKIDTSTIYFGTGFGCAKTTKRDCSDWMYINEGLEYNKYKTLNIITSDKEEKYLFAGCAGGGGDIGGIVRRKIRK